MAFTKGQSGNPGGRVKDKPWRDALMVALSRPDPENPDRKMLARIAEQVVAAAAEGKMDAAKEIGDRVDGKPPQAIVGDNEADPVNVLTEIRRIIVKPGHKDR
jgi:hypothetical protein